ncbi:hypothetical protein EG68_07147 [Paragonimus skrjabini miyazakii]|uniref:Protein NRDE2 homolog n=1 Tax=Paragonimus skrjabini miyazakii TaxID=59628 RepID=A0A8S9YSA4_9TREM|nr:hypothetical protein EG68_07147 [Paragonimus skrjabini miyazakii]
MFPSGSATICDPEQLEDLGRSASSEWLQSSTYSEKVDSFRVPANDSSKIPYTSKTSRSKRERRTVSHRAASELPINSPNLNRKAVFLEDISGLKLEDAYRIDRSSNREIYTFGSIYEKHVARFKSRPRTPIVGFKNLRLCDLFDSALESSHKRVKRSRYFSKHSRSVLTKPAQLVPVDTSVSKETEDLLHLMPDFTDLPIVPNQCTTNSTMTLCESLNRRVYDKPNDLRSWMELIDLQAKEAAFLHVKETTVSSSDPSFVWMSVNSSDRLLVLRKQLAMAERALTANPGCIHLKILTLRIAELAAELECRGASNPDSSGGELFQPERIGRDWAQLAFTYPQMVSVWRGYIAHLMGKYAIPLSATQTIGNGLFARIDGIYKRALSTLSGIISGRILSHRPQPDTAEQAVDLLTDYCHWLVQAGHAERALALWQAVIEFNCFRPSDLIHTPTDQCLLEMELYWSSGAARFGQPGAEHWCGWYRLHRNSQSGERHRSKDGKQNKKVKRPPSCVYLLEEVSTDSTTDQLQSKWMEIADKLKSISSTCEDALIQCSTDALLGDAQQKLDQEVVPSVLSSAVPTDQWVRRGAVRSLTGNASIGKSRTLLYRRGQAWVGLERAREAVGWLPSDTLTTSDDVDDEDPERLVLFDDIKPCLLELLNLQDNKTVTGGWGDNRPYAVTLQQRLLLQCLEFLGAYEPSVAATYQLPADLRVVHDLALVGPIQRQNLSPLLNQHSSYGLSDRIGIKDKFGHLAGGHHDIWVKARRCFLDTALNEVCHIPEWNQETRTRWLATVGRLRFQVALDRLLEVIQSHDNISVKTIIASWRYCGRSIMAQSHNQQDLHLWKAYATGFWYAALTLSTPATNMNEIEPIVTESRRIFDTTLTTYPIPDELSYPAADTLGPLVDHYQLTFAPRLKLIQQYIDLELGVFPGAGGRPIYLGRESYALQLLIYAAIGGTYSPPSEQTLLRPSTLVRSSHAYGKRMESIWQILAAMPEDSRMNMTLHGPLLNSLTALTPTLAYLSFMFDLLTTDQQTLSNSLPSLMSVLHRIDRLRAALIRTRPTDSRWSEDPNSNDLFTVRHRVCARQFITLVIGGLSAFSALRQRNRRALLQELFSRLTVDCAQTKYNHLPLDIPFPTQLTYLLPPRVALEKSVSILFYIKSFSTDIFTPLSLLPLSLDNASSCHGLLSPMFLTQLTRQMNQFCQQVAELAAESSMEQITVGFRGGTSQAITATRNWDPIGTNVTMFCGPQLDMYVGCLPVTLDLILLSLELERWTSLLAGTSVEDRSSSAPACAADSVNSQRVRNAFERAVRVSPFVAPILNEHGGIRHISLVSCTPSFWAAHLRLVVWRAYMAFGWMSCWPAQITRTANQLPTSLDPRQRRQAVKAVFYRAIEDLPWAKVLYTDLVRYCPEDVEEVVDLLSERELRLRTPLEELDLLLSARPVAE